VLGLFLSTTMCFLGGHVLGETVYVQYVQENALGLTAETAKIGCSIIP
jgi:hypothetical protein